jgi:WD40 repeat protein
MVTLCVPGDPTPREVPNTAGMNVKAVTLLPQTPPALVVADAHGALRLYATATGEWQRLAGPVRLPRVLAASASGGVVVCGCDDGSVTVWDVPGRRLLRTLRWHTQPICAASLSRTGDRVASTDNDGNVCLWSTADGALLAVLTGGGRGGASIDLSPDGRSIARAGASGLELWPAESDGPLASVDHGLAGPVTALAVSPDRRIAALGNDRGEVSLIDVARGTVARHLTAVAGDHTPRPIRDLSFAADGSCVYAADGENLLSAAVDGGRGAPVLRPGEVRHPGACAFSPQLHLVLRVGVRGVDLATAGEAAAGRSLDNMPAARAGFAAHGDVVCIVGAAGGVKFVNLRTGVVISTVDGYVSPAAAVAVTRTCDLAAVAAADGSVRLWDLVRHRERRLLRGQRTPVDSLQFSADGRFLLTVGPDEPVRIWNVGSGREVRKLTLPDGQDGTRRLLLLMEDDGGDGGLLLVAGRRLHAYRLRASD